jgi:aminoglycoside phosphotransferase (APT) family kinase protein
VPEPVAACADERVIGAPFYVMRFVDGLVINDAASASALPPAARATATGNLGEALARIHRTDLTATGLASLSKHEGHLARQLRAFGRQIDDEDDAQRPLLRRIAAELEATQPPQTSIALVHGDFKLGNCIVSSAGGVNAVLDWELTTLGDPRVDVGWLVASWLDPETDAPRIVVPPTTAGGFGSVDDALAAYARVTPLDASTLSYFTAFAEWRWACIDVGTHKRFARQQMGGASIDLPLLEAEIEDRLHRAADLLALPRRGR